MQEKITALRADCTQEIEQCTTSLQLQEVKVKYMGKSGLITALLKGMKDVAPEDRPKVGSMVNQLRNELESVLEKKTAEIAEMELQHKLKSEKVDISLKSLDEPLGTLHPVTLITQQIQEMLIPLGFKVLEGPEIETDYYSFQALNIPKDHPARDMQDTFYITDSILLRPHTSPMQARFMENNQPPIKIVCPGKVFRSDSDASHSPVFHQIEGLVVDKHLTLCDLKGTLEYIAQNLFTKDTKVRFRPSYFPFTEPSVEVDLSCSNCGGKGCSLCKGTGWIEVLGAGMVNPFVLENCGIDSRQYTGYAFGIGIERIAMIKYGIPDIRLFYENDARFLRQFKK